MHWAINYIPQIVILGILALSGTAFAEARAPKLPADALRRPNAIAPGAPTAVLPNNANARRPVTGAQPLATPKPADPAVMAAMLSRAVEERARQILERYVPQKEFQLTATVVPSGKALPSAPYDPKGATGALLSMDAEEFDQYVRGIRIELLVNARLRNNQRKIEELLFKSLKLKRNRDKITIGNLGIEIESEEWSKEKSDLKNEMSRIKSENEKMQRELEAAEAGRKAAEAANGAKEKDNFWQDFMEKNARLIWIGGSLAFLLGFIALIGLLTLARSFSRTGKNLASALGTIGQSMETMGGSISMAATSVAEKNQAALPAGFEGKLISDGKGGGGNGMSNMALDSIHAHLVKTRQELLDGYSENSESLILKHLTNLTASPATVGKAVVSMELLGRETATALFRKLGINSQEALLKFLHDGNHERSKIELMLEAGEDMKTKLLAESFDRVRGGTSEKISDRLLQLTIDEVVQVARDLDPNVLPRLFLYLDPNKIATVLSTLKRVDEQKFEATVTVLPKMADASTLENFDEEIMRALEAIIDRTRADAQRPYLKVYQEIVEASDEDVGESILRELSSNPRLDSYFRENVINLATFFRMSEEARIQIIESLSNKDVAALASGVREDEQSMVLDGVPERRKNLVMEEFDSLTSRGGRQAAVAFKKVKDLVVKKMRDMKADGSLSEVLQTNDGSEGGGGSGRRRKKAA